MLFYDTKIYLMLLKDIIFRNRNTKLIKQRKVRNALYFHFSFLFMMLKDFKMYSNPFLISSKEVKINQLRKNQWQ